MTWFGSASAWAAAVVGVSMVGLVALRYSWGFFSWLDLVTALLLFVGSVRTLKKASGGLRLLAGAWGVVAGLTIAGSFMLDDPRAPLSFLVIGLPWIAVVCLALVVLHKEAK